MKQTKEEIFIQAYGDYEKSLLKRSFFKVSNHELADDLVQNTFLKTWEYLVKNGDIDSMRAFLFHILNDLIIDEYRKKKSVSLDKIMEGGFEIAIDDSDTLIDTIDGKTVMLLIPLLTERHAEVVSMKYIEDMTLKEIASATHQSRATVAVQIHRGMEKLAILFRIEEAKSTKTKSSTDSESSGSQTL
jgi:RNA polymerase sigma factor (sigma-70 family)